MRIDKDHLYYGAAVIQIAEHPSFTAINDFQRNKARIRCAYWINQDIGAYLKYRTKADRKAQWTGKDANEYLFVFGEENLDHIRYMQRRAQSSYVCFVCVEDRQICCVSTRELLSLISRRRDAMRHDENQYTVVVALPERSNFRVYVTPPGRRNQVLGDPLLAAQKDFPQRLFS